MTNKIILILLILGCTSCTNNLTHSYPYYLPPGKKLVHAIIDDTKHVQVLYKNMEKSDTECTYTLTVLNNKDWEPINITIYESK